MASDLIKLIERIDPGRTLDHIHRRADEAVNSYPRRAARVTSWPEFECSILEFCLHVEARILGLEEPASGNHEFHWGRFHPILREAYGPSGEKAAFELARTGTEGGLYGVFRTLGRILAEHYADQVVAGLVHEYWGALSVSEQHAAIDDYLRHYGRLLPSEMTEGSAARLRANFPQVLEEHPRIMRRLRSIGRH